MTTTRVLATALPYSLADDAPFHLSVFFTHRLTPEATPATLADFPETADWIGTLNAGTLDLVTDTAPDGIPVRFVSAPDPDAWHAVFPPQTPVAGFPTPSVTDEPWRTWPAHTIDGHALDVHLGSAMASPFTPPGVLANPVADGVLRTMMQVQPGVENLYGLRDRRAERDQRIRDRKLAEVQSTLGQRARGHEGSYPSEAVDESPSAIEVLLDHADGEARATEFLDRLTEEGPPDDPVLATLRDVHAARRFYQREAVPYRETPDPNAERPRPPVPVHDFHERAAGLGSTPVLLRTLGLVVDVAVDDAAQRDLLASASWVAARYTPAEGADVVRLAPPRIWCQAEEGSFQAVSTGGWSGGAVPLGDPDAYTVLDLDPDASALKLEQHLRDLPRALASELNGDPASSAPGSLRSTGFSIARIGRDQALLDQVNRAGAFQAVDDDGAATGPDLVYDDVVRGIRLEVWDDRGKAWHSVHERRVDVEAAGTPVLSDAVDSGFLQLTGLNRVPGSAYHLHEVFVGWDGWSLSAPRPGKVIVHGPDGKEHPLDEPTDDPATDVLVHSRVEPGTLPWLRYGRRYSFRVRGVDLAGNSVPRPPATGAPTPEAVAAAGDQLERLRHAFSARDRAGLLGAVREGVLSALGRVAGEQGDAGATLLEQLAAVGDDLSAYQDRIAGEAALEPRIPTGALTGVEDVDLTLRSRVTARLAGRADAVVERSGVLTALERVARARDDWRARPNLDLDAATFAGLDDTRNPIRVRPDRLPDLGFEPPPPPPPEVPVVTTPRPFLRWHPVPPPSLVARRPLGTGESLQRLVVREGRQAERHVVPPKSTQLEAEQHGMFDDAIGSTNTAVQDHALAVALKERGTLLDEWIQDLTDANGRLHQDGIALHTRPGADPDAEVSLADIDAERDTPLGEGQYVVHDTDQLVLPYLPDPLARGVSLVFYDAGAPHTLPEPRVLQTVVLPFAGDWPALEPLRLVLEGGAALGARREGNVVTVALPPGEQVRAAMSSALAEEDLDLLGLWRNHVASAADKDARRVLARAGANGWFWWLTPAADMRLVHAVPRPVRPPELAALKVLLRPSGLTVAALAGVVDVHGPSTERLVLEARWSEWVDDIAADGPVRVDRHDVVLSSPVQPDEHFGLLFLIDAVLGGTDGTEPVVSHKAIQNFPDTHHRRVRYAARGLTRYAEFFEPADRPAEDDPTLLGAPRELTVASSARPSAPEVVDVVPLLLWEDGTEPDQPFALRRARRSGARIWLERPWFSSGDGELLAVVLGGPGVPPTLASRWGKDPVQLTGVPANVTLPPLVSPRDMVLAQATGEVVDPRPGRPVTPSVAAKLVDANGRPEVRVLGYRPEYHPGRKQWFVDVALDPGDSLWPFVRLAVARYQPDSLEDHTLSPVVLADWVQPLPERVTTANRRTADTVRITVTGPIGLTRRDRTHATTPGDVNAADGLLRQSREVFATLQEAPDDGESDLEWHDRVRMRLPLVGFTGSRATWSEELELPSSVALATPRSFVASAADQWRVLVEEYEYFDADPAKGPKEGRPDAARRLVYADTFTL